jgi:hypothetical protein
MSFFSKLYDESPETRDKPRRFVLSKDHRSITDTVWKKTAFFEDSVFTKDIEDYYVAFNYGYMNFERVTWQDM